MSSFALNLLLAVIWLLLSAEPSVAVFAPVMLTGLWQGNGVASKEVIPLKNPLFVGAAAR